MISRETLWPWVLLSGANNFAVLDIAIIVAVAVLGNFFNVVIKKFKLYKKITSYIDQKKKKNTHTQIHKILQFTFRNFFKIFFFEIIV